MARPKVSRVRLRVLVSFNGMRVGDEAEVAMSPLVQGWINAGMAEVVRGGKDQAGPGGAEPDVGEREPERVEDSVPAGGEPGQGFGAGAYGTPERLDPS